MSNAFAEPSDQVSSLGTWLNLRLRAGASPLNSVSAVVEASVRVFNQLRRLRNVTRGL